MKIWVKLNGKMQGINSRQLRKKTKLSVFKVAKTDTY